MKSKMLGAAFAAAMTFAFSAGAANASSYLVTLDEVGSNVVATGSGAVDLTALTFSFSHNNTAVLAPRVHLPLLPALIEAIAAGPTSDLAFICGVSGKPMTKESFGNAFSDACRAAGVNKSAHGLRKIGATRAAENGATVAQLNAIFGWTGSKMASLYTQNPDRKRLAQDAIGKLVNENRTSIHAPSQKVGVRKRKA